MPLAGGVEDQPARWYQLVTVYGGEKARLEQVDRDLENTKRKAHGK